MSLVSRLTEKSWETPGAHPAAGGGDRPPAAKVVLVLYFGVAAVLFGLVTSAYLMRMGMPGMGHGEMGGWRPLAEPPLLWGNTLTLFLASFAWEGARITARRGRGPHMWTLAAGLLGIIFLIGQVLLWRVLVAAGHGLRGDPAAAFFYLITALHGVHVLGGLYFWARALLSLGGGGAALRVQLTATYWHFLLFVWLVMLGLFVAT